MIETLALSKSFGARVALAGVNLAVAAGERMALRASFVVVEGRVQRQGQAVSAVGQRQTGGVGNGVAGFAAAMPVGRWATSGF